MRGSTKLDFLFCDFSVYDFSKIIGKTNRKKEMSKPRCSKTIFTVATWCKKPLEGDLNGFG